MNELPTHATTGAIHIAIVEDERLVREELGIFLREEGWRVHEADSAQALDEILVRHPLEAVILDIGLPGESGIELARRLRERYPDLGVLMLTARTGVPDRIASYDAGADLYLPKPVVPNELLAALRSLLRRARGSAPETAWRLDMATGNLHIPGRPSPLLLNDRETRLMCALAVALPRPASGESLCLTLRQDLHDRPITRRALEITVSRLRRKLASAAPDLPHGAIRSDWQNGYQLLADLRIEAR